MLEKMAGYRSVRWVSRTQLHVTLRFIGDFEESLVPKLAEGLKKVVLSAEPFEVEVGGLGAFPRMDRPRVLFRPVLKGGEGFERLERDISKLLVGFGVKPDDKAYHPHLTLGRVRGNEDTVEAIEALREACQISLEPWQVDRFVLFQSRLALGGAVYTGLGEFVFGKR